MQKKPLVTKFIGFILVVFGFFMVTYSSWDQWNSSPISHAQSTKPTSQRAKQQKPTTRAVQAKPTQRPTKAKAHKGHGHHHGHNHGHGSHAAKSGTLSKAKELKWFEGPLPGMKKHPKALSKRFSNEFIAKGKKYKPRTHHFWANGIPKYTNRLLFETSPYLLQHAHNPVNWHAWGKKAFALAKKQNKPVFLSVGYSTCHWCHVMERESFENPKIAAYINKHYIAIKVDREERLDVDGIYMKAVQIFSRGGGGWPMSVWLTPTRRPFFGGTYFPPRDRWGRKGFLSVLKSMYTQFKKNPIKIANKAYFTAQRIRAMTQTAPNPGVPQASLLIQASYLYGRFFDSINGGMRGRPKFPSSFGNAFLLRYHRRSKNAKALNMAVTTLEKMAYGGIYDQVAGGFHRYSVDARWLVPHFEKMLYDNAQLATLYTEGYLLTRKPLFAQITHEILAYVVREMTSPKGGFYSATDADSEGHEGKFFVWTPKQLDKILGKKLSKTAQAYWGVTPAGNFEGKNILNLPVTPSQVAKRLNTSTLALRTSILRAKSLLYKARLKRIPPLLDTKIITSWNGLMITAFARASLAFGREDYAKVAAKAANFILTRMKKKGRLFRTFKDGQAKFNAYLEDYAFLIAGLLDLFEATQNTRWYSEALALQNTLQKYYWDNSAGGYFRTSQDHESLIIRPKPNYDGAVPTGNSVESLNLLRFYTYTTKEVYRKRAALTFKAFGKRLQRWAPSLSEMLLALDFYHDAPKEIILVKPNKGASITPFLKELQKTFLPNKVIVVATAGGEQKRLTKLFPLLDKKKPLRGKVTAYVCMRRVCELPTTNPAVFAKQIRKVTKLK